MDRDLRQWMFGSTARAGASPGLDGANRGISSRSQKRKTL